MKKLIGYALLLSGLHFGIANAHDHNAADSVPNLTPQTQGGVTYVDGGIGNDQQEALKMMRKDFNLQLTFAKKDSGEYVADVNVNIQDMSGTSVLEIADMGPIFMAKLEPGKYQVKVTSHDKTQTKQLTINKNGMKSLDFYW